MKPKYSATSLHIFLLGFSSAVPFLLILSTLSAWLSESGVTKTQIGAFAWATAPYCLKFIWAPAIDNIRIPFLYDIFGKRRSWLLVSQIALFFAISKLGQTNPDTNLLMTAVFAFLVGFCSANQDIVIEAYRIESATMPEQNVRFASFSALGYRFGMLTSGAGALYLAGTYNNWYLTYQLMAAVMLIGVGTTLACPEPQSDIVNSATMIGGFKDSVWKPFKEFMRRDWWLIIRFIFFYKFADAVLNSMSVPFLIEIGFSKVEIAHVAKTFGISSMILGVLAAGILLPKIHLRKSLCICVILQSIAAFLFLLQSQTGYSLPLLFIVMGFENFVSGLSQVALISYLSHLCHIPFTATHYALVSSIASLCRITHSSLGGLLADILPWPQFYAFVTVFSLFALLVLWRAKGHFMCIDGAVQHDTKITNNFIRES